MHGTISSYRKGCKCDSCKGAWATYMREYAARRRAAGVACAAAGCDLVATYDRLCSGCRTRKWRSGDVKTDPGNRSEVDYQGAHDRVKRLRGTAAMHPCVDCGGGAREWSLRSDATMTRVERSSRGRTYSLDPNEYEPRCTTCHGAYDSGARRNRVA